MDTILCYKVLVTRSMGGDGIGPTICIARFYEKNLAEEYAKGKDEWGMDGRVEQEIINIYKALP